MRKFLLLLFILTNFIFSRKILANISLESYCRDGYYKIPNEEVCSRAPLCGGKSYDEVAALPAPNPQSCLSDIDDKQKGCKGWVPLCCYEVARTGNPMMCVGYWERLWCHPSQCQQIDLEKGKECNGGNPGTCLCGHAFKFWCKDLDAPQLPISLEARLGLKVSPSSTPKPTSVSTPEPKPTIYVTPQITPSLFYSPTLKPNQFFFNPSLFPLMPTTTYQPTKIYPTIVFDRNKKLLPSFPPLFFSPLKFFLPKINLLPKFSYDQIKTAEIQLKKPLDLFYEIFLSFKKLDSSIEVTINNFLNNLIPQKEK